MDPVILGTEIKFVVNITALGFNINDDDFTLFVMKGRNIVKEIDKTELIVDEEHLHILCLDSAELGAGTFDLAVKAEIPDSHFPDGYRTEIARVPLMTVKKL